MAYIYYCKKCGEVYSSEKDNEVQKCPSCKVNMLATHYLAEEWRSKNDKQKEELRSIFDNMDINNVKIKSSDSLNSSDSLESLSSSNSSNSIGKTLDIVGWLYIALSAIGAFILFLGDMGVIFPILVAISGALFGLLLVGFGEVINLLQDIKNK